MISIRRRDELPDGNIVFAPEQTICCTTNCVGAMGAGVALSVKLQWPHVYKEYRKLWRMGKLHYHCLYTIPADDKLVLLFPTKVDWNRPSPIMLIEDNLKNLVDGYEQLGIESLALTRLGTMCGGIKDYALIDRMISDALDPIPIACTLYV